MKKSEGLLTRFVSRPPGKPLFLYDGNCPFCRRWAFRLQRMTGKKVEYAPFQTERGRFAEIPARQFEEYVQIIEPDGRVYCGAEAIYKSLNYSRVWKWLYPFYRFFPPFAFFSRQAYRLISRHRHRF